MQDNIKVARAIADELSLPNNIINLDAEKQVCSAFLLSKLNSILISAFCLRFECALCVQRIRELLESGYQTMPRREGQRKPSFMVQPSTGHVALPHKPLDVHNPSGPKVHVTDEMVAEEMRHSNCLLPREAASFTLRI